MSRLSSTRKISVTVRIPAQVFRTLAPIRAIDCISLVIVSYYVSMVCIDRSRKARGVCDCSLYLTPKQEYSVKVTAWLSCDSPSFRGAPVAVAHAAEICQAEQSCRLAFGLRRCSSSDSGFVRTREASSAGIAYTSLMWSLRLCFFWQFHLRSLLEQLSATMQFLGQRLCPFRTIALGVRRAVVRFGQ
jgi:hypothetical protein